MANETLSFDIVGRDAGASRAFRSTADSALLAARGARQAAVDMELQRKSADASARASLSLASADKILAEAERELSGEAAKARIETRRQADETRRLAEEARRAKRDLAAGGGGGRGGFFSGLFGGIGPGIPGVGTKAALGVAGISSILASLPAIGAIGGVLGVAGIGAKELIGSKQNKGPLFGAAKQAGDAFTSAFRNAATGMEKPLKAVFEQIPRFVRSITPALRQVFGAVGPLLGPLLHGFEGLVKGLLPGLIALLRSARPAITAFAGILGTLGRDLGGMLRSFSAVVKPSALVLKALADVISGLFPVIGKLAVIMAHAVAPVFAQLGAVVRSLEPVLVVAGKIIGDLARAVFADLVGALGAAATLIRDLAPSLGVLVRTLGNVFGLLENSGVFAILGNALEKLAPLLARLVNTIVIGLAPVLPPVIRLVGQLATIAVNVLSKYLQGVIPIIISLVKDALNPLVPLLIELTPLISEFAKLIGFVLVQALKYGIPLLKDTFDPINRISGALTTVIKWVGALAANWRQEWADIKSFVGVAVTGIRRVLGQWLNDMLGVFGDIVHAAAATFGWIPGIGPKLRQAAGAFDQFRSHVVAALDGIHVAPVNVPIGVVLPGGKHIPGFASGTTGAARGWAMVGEKGPELAYFHGGEHVLSNRQTRKVLGYASGTGFGVNPMFPSVAAIASGIASVAHVIGEKMAGAFARHILGGGVSGSVSSYAGLVLQVLGMLGQPSSDLGVVLRQMTTESGGNPWIVNRSDSNWFAGHPSVGLMQVIAGTFAKYAGPFRRTGPFEYGVSVNPLANIFAGLNYATHAYGAGWTSVLGQGHGYDRGGYLPTGWSMAYNGTGRPEPVGWNYTGRGGDTYIFNVPESSNPAEVGRILATKLAAFKKQGGYIYRPAGF